MPDPITKILSKLVIYFDNNKIPYVVVGGVAVLVFGRTRLTQDVDIIVDHVKLNRQDFIEYLRSEGFDANLSDLEAFDEKMHCSLFLKDGMFRIDLKGVYGQKELDSINEAVESSFNDIKIKIDNPESLIVNKLIFGSEQDYEDALAVYIRNFEMISDAKLLERSRKYNVESLMNTFIQEVNEFLEKKK